MDADKNITAMFSASLSTDEVFTKTVAVYPNPTIGNLTIDLLEDLKEVQVYSLTGKKVFVSTSKNIDIEHLSSGVYMLRIISEEGKTATKRIIKK